MGVEELTFTSDSEAIYDPQVIASGGTYSFKIQNLTTNTYTGLGLFIVPATLVGDVANPADEPRETDYQDLIKWGEQAEQGIAASGGLRLTVPQTTGGDLVARVTRQAGSTLANKIPLKDLAPNQEATVSVELQTPVGVLARRMYISLRVDSST